VVVILGFLVRELVKVVDELAAWKFDQQNRNECVRIRLAELKNEIDCKADKSVAKKVSEES
jgi:Zn ribbon nucleic-acid-binding protein